MNGFSLSSTLATAVYFAILTGGFVWTTYNPGAPYLIFASQATIGYVAYITKRLMQKKDVYNEIKIIDTPIDSPIVGASPRGE